MPPHANRSGGFQQAHEVSCGFGSFFDLGDAAGSIVRGIELIRENVGIGIDHAEEIVDRMRNSVKFRDGAAVDGWLLERK